MSDEEDIFEQALRIDEPQERQAFLHRACADQPRLRRQVELLLEAHEQTSGILESPVVQVLEARASEQPGTLVGNYKLLEQIGEGGMGVVYMAEQLRPVKRRVALKILKPGLDTKQVIARFEAERQALAMMDHPNIARVFDAGVTDTGRPYFAMELVRGIPITQYCDQDRLTPRQRLELFVQVCQAVQHAHQKGIIHRDLKPTNVLVTLADDGKPVSKIIDFGIAKATGGQRLVDQTLFTEFRQLIGTPLYMSPEQAERSAMQDVDTRSDVYSLGVMLYELLTGTTPFDKHRLAQAAYDEVRRIIREEEPPRPSTRLSTLGQTLTSISAQRQTDPKKLSQAVRGELDWIVMKALEKDRARRYETANGLARDVERYLTDQPVEACPPSRVYRLRKTIRRNKAVIATASAILTVLVAATIVSTWEAVSAHRAKAASDRAAATANNIANYLEQMIVSADPTAEKDADYTIRIMLDQFADGIGTKLDNQPEAEAEILTTVGLAYHRLGHAEKGEKHLARALELNRRVFGEQSEKVADSLVRHADAMKVWASRIPRGQQPGAEPLRKQVEAETHRALDIYKRIGIAGQPVLRALVVQLQLLRDEKKYSEMQVVAEQGLAVARQTPGIEFPEVADFYGGLGDVMLSQKKKEEAEAFCRQRLAVCVHLRGPNHKETGWSYYQLAEILRAKEQFADALAAGCQAWAIFRRVYPPHHYSTGSGGNLIIGIITRAGDSSALLQVFPSVKNLSDIEALFRQVADAEPSTRGYLIDIVGTYMKLGHELDSANNRREAEVARAKANELASSLRHDIIDPQMRGRIEESLEKFSDAMVQYDEAIRHQPNLAELWASLANCERHVGAFAKGRDDYLQAAKLDPGNLSYWIELGALDMQQHDHKEAILDYSKAIALGDTNADMRSRRGMSYQALGQWPEAITDYSRAIEINPGFWGNRFARARLYSRMGEHQKAKADVADAIRYVANDTDRNEIAWELATSEDQGLRDVKMAVALAERVVQSQPLYRNAWNTLGVARYRCGDYPQAIEALKKSGELHNEKVFAWDAFFLAMSHWQLGHKAEARQWYDQAIAWMDKNQPHNQELIRFRAEAQSLMVGDAPATIVQPQ